MDPSPLFPFGHGLSHTSFEYSELRISASTIGPTDPVVISAKIRNSGPRTGEEIVQLYAQDVIATVATPIKSLKGFAKVRLDPGEITTVTFKLTPDDLSLFDRGIARVVEPGEFRVMIGSSSEDIRLKGSFTVAK